MKLSPLVLDRHAFASNASSFDTAWRTFGWTPAILDRAGSLEESVPWATAAATADQPGRLRGRAEDVLDPANFDRLQFAFLRLDGRLGFSVWGATERVRGAPEWRVLTHTLLFDHDAFDRLAGFPFALLRDSEHDVWFRVMIERATFDEPAPLEPIVVPASAASRAAFERARLREIARLRDLLSATYGGPGPLEYRLAQVYESLAGTYGIGSSRRVALRTRAGNTAGLLTRLAWISLPLSERAGVFFSTEQRKMESPPATLFVLPEAEWGRYVPEATHVLEFSGAPAERVISRGRAHWAAAVVGNVALHGRLSAATERRGWRLIARDDIGRLDALHQWRNRGRTAVLDYDAARELIAIETQSGIAAPRLRVRSLGHVVARATQGCGLDANVRAARARELLRLLPPAALVPALRAAVRTLARGSEADRQTGAFLRIEAAHAPAQTAELLRLLDAESALVPALLHHPEGALTLFRAARALALAGHVAGERLAELAVPQLRDHRIAVLEAMSAGTALDARAARWLASVLRIALEHARSTPELIAETIEAWDPAWLMRDELLGRLVAALWRAAESEQAGAESARQANRLLRVILVPMNGQRLSPTQIESILRLSWIELQHNRSRTALERHVEDYPHAALTMLIQLLVSSPPLPLFLRIRRTLVRVPQTHLAELPELEHWRAPLQETCPAVYARMQCARGLGQPLAKLR